MTHKFKVGDRVKIAPQVCRGYIKDTGLIIGVSSSAHADYPYQITMDGTNKTNCYWSERYLTYASVIYSEDHLKEKDIL